MPVIGVFLFRDGMRAGHPVMSPVRRWRAVPDTGQEAARGRRALERSSLSPARGVLFGDARNLEDPDRVRYYGPFPSEAEARAYAEYTPPGWDVRTFTREEQAALGGPDGGHVFYGPDMGIYEEVDVSTGEISPSSYERIVEKLEGEDE